MSESHAEEVKTILEAGETLLWQDHPQQGIILRRSDMLFIPVSLCFGAISVTWEVFSLIYLFTALNIGDVPAGMIALLSILTLIGLPFVVLAAFLLVGRFYYDRKRRQHTHYALSSQRIIILSGLFNKRNVRSIALDKLGNCSLVHQKGEWGSIHFSNDHWLWWVMLGPVWWFPLWIDVENYQPPVFERIKNVNEVEQLIKQAQKDYLTPVQDKFSC
jgi:hypothetical protein